MSMRYLKAIVFSIITAIIIPIISITIIENTSNLIDETNTRLLIILVVLPLYYSVLGYFLYRNKLSKLLFYLIHFMTLFLFGYQYFDNSFIIYTILYLLISMISYGLFSFFLNLK